MVEQWSPKPRAEGSSPSAPAKQKEGRIATLFLLKLNDIYANRYRTIAKEGYLVGQSEKDVKLGRFLSLVLRHQPDAAGISLDEHGWADVAALLKGVCRTGRQIDMEDLERIVRENNKQRYSFNEDHTKIRANQGHSLQVDVQLREAKPPQYLYHGTAERFLPEIQARGIMKMNRQHVHLSGDFQTALAVGKRHGKPAVLKVDAGAMAQNGMVFYHSENGVWLCDYVAPAYFSSMEMD